MAQDPMGMNFQFGRASAGARRVDEDDPFRILVLADLGGAAARGPLAQRRPLALDVDKLEQVFTRIGPALTLDLDGTAMPVAFASPDDFHPDALYARLPMFQALSALRAGLQDPARFEETARALGAGPATGGANPSATDDTLTRLLGAPPPGRAASAATPDLSGWLRAAVAPHVVPDIADRQRALTAAVDATLAEQMRRVLHAPGFQALEAAWSGVTRLTRELELDENLRVSVLDASRADLQADLEAHADDLGRSALLRLLGGGPQAPDAPRWSLLVLDQTFDADAADLRLLTLLGAMAAQVGVPLLAQAGPGLLGAPAGASLAELGAWLSEPARWPAPDTHALWTALRRSAVAPWIGLAMPRLLARLPYGERSDPIHSFRFEELPPDRPLEAYLWEPAAFRLALLAGQAFQADGWAMALDGPADLDDLPGHVYEEDGEQRSQPCAQWQLGEAVGEAMLQRGVMPLLSYRNRHAARLLRWQSMAQPARLLQGAWVSG